MTAHSAANQPLVLNTRPQPMGALLEAELEKHNIASLNFPTIKNQLAALADIVATTPANNVADLLQLLSQHQTEPDSFWLFISKSSVLFFKQFLAAHNLRFQPHGNVIAVGATTQAELHQINPDLNVLTPTEANSEALLAMPEFNQCRHIILVKGVGGRGLMTKEFNKRNKQVVELNLYQRTPVLYPIEDMADWSMANTILATSVDIAQANLNNILRLPEAVQTHFFQTKAWVVLSDRIKQFLIQSGVAEYNIFVCEQSDNSSIINMINQLNRR